MRARPQLGLQERPRLGIGLFLGMSPTLCPTDVTPLVGPVIRTDRGVEGEVRSLEVAAEYSGL